MGTNYYLHPRDTIPRDPDDGIHLGKSSAGWRFLHRAYPDPGAVASDLVCWPITCYADWVNLLLRGAVYDEYGTKRRWTWLMALVDERAEMRHNAVPGVYQDATGADFYAGEFS